MTPSSFFDALKQAADRAAAAEDGFRREAAARAKALERERAFAFRRLNFKRHSGPVVRGARALWRDGLRQRQLPSVPPRYRYTQHARTHVPTARQLLDDLFTDPSTLVVSMSRVCDCSSFREIYSN
jgi:hypothetical protein